MDSAPVSEAGDVGSIPAGSTSKGVSRRGNGLYAVFVTVLSLG